MTSTGWCIDSKGKEPETKSKESGYTEEQCFKLCEDDSSFTACTFIFDRVDDYCKMYSGLVENGSGHRGYKCHYHTGNFSAIG